MHTVPYFTQSIITLPTTNNPLKKPFINFQNFVTSKSVYNQTNRNYNNNNVYGNQYVISYPNSDNKNKYTRGLQQQDQKQQRQLQYIKSNDIEYNIQNQQSRTNINSQPDQKYPYPYLNQSKQSQPIQNYLPQLHTLLQKNLHLTKTNLSQYSKQLRYQICLKIQQLFRKIQQYGQQFYQSIQQYVIQDIKSRQYSLNQYIAQDRSLLGTIVKYMQNKMKNKQNGNGCLFSCERMQIINRKIIDKVQKYMNEVIQKYMGTLFHFSNQFNTYKTNNQDNTNDNDNRQTRNINIYAQTSRDTTTYKQHTNNNSKRDNNIKQYKYKSMSLQKYSNKQQYPFNNNNRCIDTRNNSKNNRLFMNDDRYDKQEQFQQLNQIITKNKNKNKYKQGQGQGQQINMQRQHNKQRLQLQENNLQQIIVSDINNPYCLQINAQHKNSNTNTNTNMHIISKQTAYFNKLPKQQHIYTQHININNKNKNKNKITAYYNKSQKQQHKQHNNNLTNRIKQLNQHSYYSQKQTTRHVNKMFNHHKYTTYSKYHNNNNNNNVSISPVISRLQLQPTTTRNMYNSINYNYNIGNNQQHISIQWCQQVKIKGDIRTITVPTKQDKTIAIQNSIQQAYNKLDKSNNNNNKNTTNTQNNILCITFCNNYSHIAVGSKNSYIYIYTHQNYTQLQQQQLTARSLPNNQFFNQYSISITNSKNQISMHRNSQRYVTKLIGHSSAICCLHYNNNILFSGGDINCCNIYLWSTITWTIRTKLSFHTAAVCSIISIPNTHYILSCSFDKTITLYNYQNSEIVDVKHSTNTVPYCKILCYQQLERVVVMMPNQYVDVFQIGFNNRRENNKQKEKQEQKQKQKDNIKGISEENQINRSNEKPLILKLIKKQPINCQYKVTTIQKAATSQSNLLITALVNSTIKIFKLPNNQLLKTINFNKGTIINMLTISRSNKNQYPLISAVCHSSRVLYLVNTQTDKTTQLNIKGNLEIDVGCGVGPVMVFSDRNQIAWVDQSKYNPKVYIGKFQIY